MVDADLCACLPRNSSSSAPILAEPPSFSPSNIGNGAKKRPNNRHAKKTGNNNTNCLGIDDSLLCLMVEKKPV